MISVSRFVCAALLMSAAWVAQGERRPFAREPLLGHILEGRTVEVLDGPWEIASVRTAVVATNGFDLMGNPPGTVKIVRDEPVDIAGVTNWMKTTLPCNLRGFFNWKLTDLDTYLHKYIFVTPKGWRTGDGVILSLERIGESFDIYMNGKMTHTENAMVDLCRRLDISQNVKEGTNTLVVALRQDGRRHFWQDSIDWYLTEHTVGITGPVHLEFTGPCYLRRAHVLTYLDPKPRLVYEAKVVNLSDAPRKLTLSCVIAGAPKVADKVVEASPGETTVRTTFDWSAPHLWSPADPYLYNADFTLSEGVARMDALRTRFGFREVKAKGHRMYLNGKPIIFRRATAHPGGDFATEEEMKEGFARLRKDGIVALRVRWSEQERIAKAADEWGMMLEPCAYSTMAAGGRPASYWRKYEAYLLEMVDQLRDHPSIVDWAISNEFGTFYHGEGTPMEKETTPKQVRAGQLVAAADPTRVWTACGESDLSYPARSDKGGPAPVRSVHYPFQVTANGHELPNAAYWYANGEIPWQGNGKKDKPLFISEDIYHGAQDSFRGLSKYAGDHHYEMEGEYGYFNTLAWIVRTYAEGYYFTGIGQWEPWCLFPGYEPRCRFYDNGPVMPDYLFTLREFPRNLFAGENVPRTLMFYNEWVTDVTGSVVRTDRVRTEDGAWRTIGRTILGTNITVGAGESWTRRIEVAAPAGMPSGSDYEMRLVFRMENGAELGTRIFPFKVFPRRDRPDFRGIKVFGSVADLSRSRHLVVTNVLTTHEGIEIEKWVRRGGSALFIDVAEKSWSPVEIDYGKRATRVWRRMPDSLPNIAEETMLSWEPDGYPSLAAIRKNEEDADVLWDVGGKDGLTGAALVRVYRGKGSWTICQLPLLSRFGVEPAASAVLDAVMDEFVREHRRPCGSVAVVDGSVTNNPLSELVAAMGIATQSMERANCILADGAAGLAGFVELEKLANAGKTVIVLNLPANADTNILAKYGVRLTIPAEALDKKNRRGNGVKFVTHTEKAGLLTGVSNDDLFWWDTAKMDAWTQAKTLGWLVPADDWRGTKTMYAASSVIEPLDGNVAKICTRPGAWAEFDCSNGGKLVLSTLKMTACAKNAGAQVQRTLRRVLMNAGVSTSKDRPPCETFPIDIRRAANRNFWQDPRFQKADGSFEPDGWFGGGNDLRYFPVNLCGWSLASAAYCPKEPMPEAPLKLGGVPFKMTDPLTNGGRGILVVNPSETREIVLEKPLAADRIHFLGAFEEWEHPEGLCGGPPTHFAVEIAVNGGLKPVQIVRQGVHVGWFRMCNSLAEGRAAWTGRTPSDPTATLYRWTANLPRPTKVQKITFRHTGNISGLGIVAATAEKDININE